MSSLENIENYQKYTHRSSNKSLLKKYEIPIQHFEFDYISKTTNADELEKIIDVLRSGEEGYYPDLLRATEIRLKELRPNSRFMRQSARVLDKSDLALEEMQNISANLQDWISNVNKYSRELDQSKDIRMGCDIKIRQNKPLQASQNRNEKRISSTDYQLWDKYDPDTEILKMDLEEERQRNEAIKSKEIAEKIRKDAEKYVVSGTSFTSNIDTIDDQFKSVNFNQYSTEAEAIYLSEREQEKGMEFYNTGDYELALQCFTRSIANKMNVVNLNSRAGTFLKLQRYEEALNDFNRALHLDGMCIKAYVGKAEALEGLKKYEEALDCAEFVIKTDPNNRVVQELADRVRKHCRNILRNTRMKIMEIE